MANTYQQSPPVARGVDVNHAIEQIKRQRMMKMVGALSGFFAVVVMLFGAEAAMLSQEQAPGPMLDPQPGELAPYYAD